MTTEETIRLIFVYFFVSLFYLSSLLFYFFVVCLFHQFFYFFTIFIFFYCFIYLFLKFFTFLFFLTLFVSSLFSFFFLFCFFTFFIFYFFVSSLVLFFLFFLFLKFLCSFFSVLRLSSFNTERETLLVNLKTTNKHFLYPRAFPVGKSRARVAKDNLQTCSLIAIYITLFAQNTLYYSLFQYL